MDKIKIKERMENEKTFKKELDKKLKILNKELDRIIAEKRKIEYEIAMEIKTINKFKKALKKESVKK